MLITCPLTPDFPQAAHRALWGLIPPYSQVAELAKYRQGHTGEALLGWAPPLPLHACLWPELSHMATLTCKGDWEV